MTATTFFSCAVKDVPAYEPPRVVEIGDVVELTLGMQFEDTAEKRTYYH